MARSSDMGKSKRRYNSNARRSSQENKPKSNKNDVVSTDMSIDIQETELSEDKNEITYSTVSEPNPVMIQLVKKDVGARELTGKKLLSKRKRKQVEKIREKKRKSALRSDLLKSLSEYQVSEKELSFYQSSSKLGQSSLRGKEVGCKVIPDVIHDTVSYGKKRRKRMKSRQKVKEILPGKRNKEDDIIGSIDKAEQSSSEASTSSDEDDAIGSMQSGSLETEEKMDNILEETPSNPTISELPKEDLTRKVDDDVLEEDLPEQSKITKDPAIFVEVKRTQEIQAARVLLPILAEEQLIMETIRENDVVVLSGETGSGKTTQVPQFLYEAGYSSHSKHPGMIGVTEPRRVAAVSMSKRVATEMNVDSSVVSFQIRYEGNVKDTTKIKFMTDGVLLKEIETDFLLKKYSVIIIDEAHERSVFTDILIGLLSRIVPLRRKRGITLKLIIMSATLRVEDFVESKRLFPKPPPILKIDSRQYPVTVHFNKKTPDDYVTEAYKKVCKIHRTLKAGGILVFLTGQNEVHALCSKLRRTFCNEPRKKANKQENEDNKNFIKRKVAKKFSLDNYPDVPANSGYDEMDENEDGDDEIDVYDGNTDWGTFDDCLENEGPLHILPLYSLLPSEKQAGVFRPCPEGTRLCVISTNVAETSLTIPGIKYVVDCGKVKTKHYDKLTGVSSFRISWTSKASANQRAGRAGRLEPGHCYRLFSSAVFQYDFEDYSVPEILRRPADELLLLMKNMGIDKVKNFPFPTSPSMDVLQVAENHLLDLKALEGKKTQKGISNTIVTSLGRTMGKLPVAPKYSKMILLAHQQNCLQYVITIVAALTVKELFTDVVKIDEDVMKTDESRMASTKALITQARRKWAGTGECSLLGDMMVILRAVGACEFAGCTETFCKENGLRLKAMVEIRKLRNQLTKAVNDLNQDTEISIDLKFPPPSPAQAKSIRQILLSCLGDQVARKLPQSDIKEVSLKNAYQSCSTDDPTFIHPTSAMFDKLPEYVVYQEIVETSKLYMKGVTAIDEDWLALFAPYRCTFSKPMESPTPFYDIQTGKLKCYMTSSYGPHSWSLPMQKLDFPECVDRLKWFATAFLGGEVSEELKPYVPYLLAPAAIMTKTWAKLHPRTQTILRELLNEGVSDRSTLFRIWKEKKHFLLKEYLQWMPESLHAEISKFWPPSQELLK